LTGMIDYYDLIRRAVAALTNNTIEEREALYERIRNALAGILRASEPAPSEAEIVDACLALETAIRRVEAPYSFLETLAHLPPAARASLRHALDTMHQTYASSPSTKEGDQVVSSLLPGLVLRRRPLQRSPQAQPFRAGESASIDGRMPKT
jgi:hypothetical protein